MKRLTKQCLLIVAILMIAGIARAQSGSRFGYNDMAFIIVSEEDQTVALTNSYSEFIDNHQYDYTLAYKGILVIPSTVTYNDKSYTVVEIGQNAFYNSSITEVTIPASVTLINYGFLDANSYPEKIILEDGSKTLEINSGSFFEYAKEWYLGRNIVWQGNSLDDDRNDFRSMFRNANKIEVSDAVTKLHEYQFADNQQNLKTLILGNGITEIPAHLCFGCFNLGDVIIPSSVTKIGNAAFGGCSSMKNIKIPANVTDIGASVFYSQNQNFSTFILDDADNPLTIDSPKGTVMFNFSTDSLYIGRNLNYEGESFIFSGNVAHAVIGDKVTEINYRMFCSVDSIDIGINVEKIGNYAFSQSDGLKSIVIPNATKSIGDNAFYMCHNLSSVILNEGLQEIGKNAFTETALDEITIPSTVTTMGDYALGAFTNYRKVMFADSDKPLDFTMLNSIDSLYIGRDINGFFNNTVHVVMGDKVTKIPDKMFAAGKVESVFLGNHIASIGNYAFGSCPITEIEIPANIKYIDDYAFTQCSHLKNLILNEGLDSIGMHAFNACDSIESLRLPASLKKVKREAFKNFNTPVIKELTIADSERPLLLECVSGGYYALPTQAENVYIGRDLVNCASDYYSALALSNTIDIAFGEKVTTLKGIGLGNDNTVKTVTAPWNTPISIEDKTFSQTVYQNATLLIPNGARQAYGNATGWKNFLNIKAFAYSVIVETSVGGSLYMLDQEVTAEQSLSTTVKTGSDLEIVIIAAEGYELSKLLVNEEDRIADVVNNTLRINNISEDLYVKAVFEKQSFPITAYVAEGGSLTIGNQTTEDGKTMTLYAYWDDTVVINITEGDDYVLQTITINDIDVTEQVEDGKLTMSNVRGAKNIVATFEMSVLKHLRITDGKEYGQTESFTTQKLTYKRTFDNTTSWDILLLPVGLNYDDWKDKMEIAYIYDVNVYDRNNDGEVDYTEIEAIAMKEGSSIKPNYPYLVRGKQTGEMILERGETEVAQPESITLECANTIQRIQITGSYEGVPAFDMTNHGWYAINDGIWVKSTGEGFALPYMRAYLSVEDKNGIPYPAPSHLQIPIKVVDGEIVTDAKIPTNIQQCPIVERYNLSGRRLNQFQRGFNIVKMSDGVSKKVIK